MVVRKALQNTTKHFISTTSIRGLPRIIKSEYRFLRVSWAIFTISAFGALSYFVFMLYASYTNYATVLQTKALASSNDFPKVTYCFDVPDKILARNPLEHKLMLDMEVLKIAHTLITEGDESNITMDRILSYDKASYFIETNFDEVAVNGGSGSGVKIECSYITDEVVHDCTTNKFPKFENGLVQHLDTNYFHCHEIVLPRENVNARTQLVVKIIMDAQMKEWVDAAKWFQGDTSRLLSSLGSVKVHLHSANTVGQPRTMGVSVDNKKLAQIYFQKKIEIIKEVPVKPCISDEMYNEIECQNKVRKDRIFADCGCENGNYGVNQNKNVTVAIPLCRDMTQFWGKLADFEQQENCVRKSRKEAANYFPTECLPKCRSETINVKNFFLSDIGKSEEFVKIVEERRKMQEILEVLKSNAKPGNSEQTTTRPASIRKKRAIGPKPPLPPLPPIHDGVAFPSLNLLSSLQTLKEKSLATPPPPIPTEIMYGNIAIGQKASQTGPIEDRMDAGRAVDGDQQGNCTFINGKKYTYKWWFLDLKYEVKVNKITIYAPKVDNLRLLSGDFPPKFGKGTFANETLFKECRSTAPGKFPGGIFMSCPGSARYVHIISKEPFELCEVEVFQRLVIHRADKKPVMMMSVSMPEKSDIVLSIKRSDDSEDLLVEETLVITKERLLSQIGGLCSLFVGLTLTVVAELVEMIYLAWKGNKNEEEEEKEREKEKNDAIE